LALYLLVLIMTLLGWAATNSRCWEVKRFGLVTHPQLAPNGSEWGHDAGDVHHILVYVLLGFNILHFGARCITTSSSNTRWRHGCYFAADTAVKIFQRRGPKGRQNMRSPARHETPPVETQCWLRAG
jgi:hypothetical protein